MTVLGVILLSVLVSISTIRTVAYIRRSRRNRPKGGQP